MKNITKKKTNALVGGKGIGALPDLLQNVLESSTEYSIIGKDLEGRILL